MGVEIVKAEHALYRFFGEGDELLYVGISLHPFARMGQHRGDKSWWGEVVKVTIERHPDREAVLTAERTAIKAERPRYNVVHATERKGRPQALCRFTYWEAAEGRLVTVADVAPRSGWLKQLRCRTCQQTTTAVDYFEMPNLEIECSAKCPQCRTRIAAHIGPMRKPTLFVRRAGRSKQ